MNSISMEQFAKGLTLCGFSLSVKKKFSTPLHGAAGGGHYETCEVLVAKGADVIALNEVRSKFSLQYRV